ncbi:flagellar motor switch protein FliM [Arthrobacter sp. STN4]|uniref:flagellar motor switch protein FliM n=1 Tax=Arthrobacter sp. STN4 TaxID=2923276 RepID=UPI00211A1A65|nr:flagellar motor switch protein FliM [Arthrobacter sp. STN4]MCQ9162512.1 flagellar motor switch protein FliM [Arthrobacter sp. STN4]
MPALTLRPALSGSGLERAVEPYDFRRPATLQRGHARRLELVFETFARQWATQLAARTGSPCSLAADRLTMAAYDDYAASLPEDTAMVLVALDGDEAKGVLQFPAEAALSWVACMLGGTGGGAPAFRKLTDMEQELVRRITVDALDALAYSFGTLLASRLQVEGMHFNARTAQAAATGTLMIVAGFMLTSGGSSWRVSVALPARAVLSQLDADNTEADAPGAASLLRRQVSQVPVDVAMELAPVQVTARAVLNLAVGELLPLPHPVGRPFSLTLDGKTVARAVGVTHGSRQAGKIVTTEENAP